MSTIASLDDVRAASSIVEEHVQHVDDLLTRLFAGARLCLGKCSLAADKLDILGHQIEHGRIVSSQRYTQAMHALK